MRSHSFAVEGLATTDLFLSPHAEVELSASGVRLRHSRAGLRVLIPTATPPRPGAKIVTHYPLRRLAGTPFVGRIEGGGGALRSAMAISERCRGMHTTPEVRFLNSGEETATLRAMCQETGVQLQCLGRHASPTNLVVPLVHDRLILKEAISAPTNPLSRGDIDAISRAVSDVGSVACLSSRDAALAAGALARCNGARRYVQPTGSLDVEATLALVSRAHVVVCNLSELARLVGWAGAGSLDSEEDAPGAAHDTAHALLRLWRLGLAGSQAAVCTLGRHGSVVADWRGGRLHRVSVVLADRTAGVATLAGAGDLFFAEYMFFMEAMTAPASPEHVGAAVWATHAVARRLGLGPERYAVTTAPVCELRWCGGERRLGGQVGMSHAVAAP